MGRRFKSYILIFVSMIMLTALVIPHHHHGDRLCLKQKQEVRHIPFSDCSDNHSSEDTQDNSCRVGCVTRMVLDKVECNQHLIPYDFLFTFFYSALAVPDSLLNGEVQQEKLPIYIEKLYPQYISEVYGLRAPPII